MGILAAMRGEPGLGQDADQGATRTQRLTVSQAAEALGVSVDAVRARVKRETLDVEREGGRVWVILDADQGADQYTDQSPDQGDQGVARIEDLREQVAYLRDQLRREQDAHAEARRLLAGALERIPAIEAPEPEAPPEPPEAPTEATEQPGRVEPQAQVEGPQEGAERRSWWRRLFEG
jgi:hypothetical protein